MTGLFSLTIIAVYCLPTVDEDIRPPAGIFKLGTQIVNWNRINFLLLKNQKYVTTEKQVKKGDN